MEEIAHEEEPAESSKSSSTKLVEPEPGPLTPRSATENAQEADNKDLNPV